MDPSIDRLRRQDLLVFCTIALLAIGVVMVQSASMNVGGSSWAFGSRGAKQGLFAICAVFMMLVVARFDYRQLLGKSTNPLRAPAVWGMLLAVALCALVLVPGIGKEVNGARRWITLGPIQLQPSEVAKWASVIYLAWCLVKRPFPLDKFWKGFLPTVLPVGVACILVAKEDFGTAALIAVCTLAILLVGGAKIKHLIVVLPPVLALGAVLVAGTPYRWRRMTSFWDPFADPRGEGYHMIQSLMSFASGGLAGTGLGGGVQKLGYLPEDTTDFIFSVICEELGLAGAMLLAFLYVGFVVVAWRTITSDRHDTLGKLLMFGGVTMLVTQAVINVAVATVSVPTKGMSLPLVSAGGTGLLITGGAIGLLVSVIRRRTLAPVPMAQVPVRDARELTDRDWKTWTKSAA